MADYQLPLAYRTMGGIKEAYGALFLQNDDIRSLVMPTLDDERLGDEANWYGGAYNVREKGVTSRVELKGHCFYVPYIKDSLADNRTVICMESYVTTAYTGQIKDIIFMINVFAAKSGIDMQTEDDRILLDKMKSRGYTGNKIDMIVSAICQTVDTTKVIKDASGKIAYGIGKATLLQREPILAYQPNYNFYGKQIFYNIVDFNVTPRTTEIK
jgi:hypothetical protein